MELRNKLIGCGLCEDNEFLDKYIEVVTSTTNKELTEEHHIIPRFWYAYYNIPVINGSNLVKLSYKQHFRAHYYLMKCINQSCDAFARAALHAVRCMVPTEQMKGFRAKCLLDDELTDEELDSIASIVEECRFKYCALSKWNWLIDYFNEHAVPLVNRITFKVTDEIMELSALTYKQIYSLVTRLHRDGLIDKKPFLYVDDDNTRLQTMKLVDYIETHAVDGQFECTEEFMLKHGKNDKQIMRYMDSYGTKGIAIKFPWRISSTVHNSDKIKWANYLKTNMTNDGTFVYSNESLEELNVTYKVIAAAARYLRRSGVMITLVNSDIVNMKQAKLDDENKLIEYLNETKQTSYDIKELCNKFGSLTINRIKLLLHREHRTLDNRTISWETIEKWFINRRETQSPVLISDEDAYNVMCKLNPIAFQEKPYAFSRMKLYAQLYDHGYRNGDDFYMIESKSYKIHKLKEFVKANAIDGVLIINPTILDDLDTTKSKLNTVCKSINIKLADSSVSVPPKNTSLYEYIRKFPMGAKVPYNNELLVELNVTPHKFAKVCNRLGYGVAKQYKSPIW